MQEFLSVLITVAACAVVFIPGGGYLGYRYGRKAEAKFNQAVSIAQNAAKAAGESLKRV